VTVAEFRVDDAALVSFAALNGLRMLAYVPQIVAVVRDRHGARAVSCVTWGLFAVANVSTVVYALTNLGDGLMVAIFSINTLLCLTIAVAAAVKQRRARIELGLWRQGAGRGLVEGALVTAAEAQIGGSVSSAALATSQSKT
jgi:hypothetical protein